MKRNSSISILALFVLLMVGLACTGEKRPAPPEYVGTWIAADDSTLTIRADGGCDYKSGNGNTTVTGGNFELAEDGKSFKTGFVGIGPSFKIDKAPSNGEMTLDGIIFKRSGGGSTTVK